MRKVVVIALVLLLGLILVFGLTGHVLAGQPSQECEDVRPGNSSTAPGSAFNEDGVAGTKYAGEQPQNSKNPKSVSQYDVACTNVSNH